MGGAPSTLTQPQLQRHLFLQCDPRATCSNDNYEEWEEELEDDEAKLKVEVRKTNSEWRR